MSYSINTDTSHHLVVVKYWNEVGSEEFLSYISELEQLGPFEAPFQLLLLPHKDLRLTIDTDVVRKAAVRMQLFSEDSLRVIVAPGTLGYGMGRMFGLLSPNASERYSIVRSTAEASEILGVNPKELDLAFTIE